MKRNEYSKDWSNQSENYSMSINNSIMNTSCKLNLWTTRNDFLKQSHSNQEMSWFKGSRNRIIRYLKES